MGLLPGFRPAYLRRGRDAGCQVQDCFGLTADQRLHQRLRIEEISRDRLGTQALQDLGIRFRMAQRVHHVTVCQQARNDRFPKHTGGPGDEDLHSFLFLS